jgi:hypothetical protein
MTRYSPKREDDKWLQYDRSRMENQNKTILELQNEIQEYQKRERAFLVHLHLKEKQIKVLKKEIKEIVKKQSDFSLEGKNDIYLDQLLINEFRQLKSLLKEKEEKLISKEEELASLQTTQNK